MIKYNVIKIANYFNSNKKYISDNYVMFSCPFAKVLHRKGKDNNPSFGISISDNSSIFHCFSCGISGKLKILPYKLEKYYHHKFDDLKEFIIKNEGRDDILFSFNEKEQSYVLDFDLDLYPFLSKWSFINTKILNYYNIRYNENDFIIPIYDFYNNLISIKIRNKKNYKTINNFSKRGIFFGMNKPLKQNKLLFLVEGERDLFALKQIGVNNVWATLGTLTEEQIHTLNILNYNLCLFFDNDITGISYKNKVINSNLNIPIFYIENYFNCKDPAELFEKGLLRKSLKTIKKDYLNQRNFFLDKPKKI